VQPRIPIERLSFALSPSLSLWRTSTSNTELVAIVYAQ
jgi:hypothetical protein